MLSCTPIKDREYKISILIPFSSKDPIRRRNFRWLIRYWRNELPDAEIIIGRSKGPIFCKGEALNNAFRRSTGSIIAVVDADAYISGAIIERCAKRIHYEVNRGHRLWYVPYRKLYRLKRYLTDLIIESNPACPLRLPDHLHPHCVENQGDKVKYGHRYGAMLTIFPREALELLGCFDERFKGWGGEDIALLRALDTLYAKHKTTRNSIFHLWHPFIGNDYKSRRWEGQHHPNSNGHLASRYHMATRHPFKMRKLVNEGCQCIRRENIFGIFK